jgi:hypothetical protein
MLTISKGLDKTFALSSGTLSLVTHLSRSLGHPPENFARHRRDGHEKWCLTGLP